MKSTAFRLILYRIWVYFSILRISELSVHESISAIQLENRAY